MIWHTTSARSQHPSLLPPPFPLSFHPEKMRELLITGKFSSIARENYSHYGYILIRKQKGRNCMYFFEMVCTRESWNILEVEDLNQRISGSNQLHVYVQRHRLDHSKKFSEKYFKFNQTKNYAERFSQRYWAFFGLGDEKKRYGKRGYLPDGKRNSVPSSMVQL